MSIQDKFNKLIIPLLFEHKITRIYSDITAKHLEIIFALPYNEYLSKLLLQGCILEKCIVHNANKYFTVDLHVYHSQQKDDLLFVRCAYSLEDIIIHEKSKEHQMEVTLLNIKISDLEDTICDLQDKIKYTEK